MSGATGTGNGANTPDLANYSVKMYVNNKNYGADLAEGIRHIKGYSKEDLEKKGITKGGKITAEGLMLYVNEHIAKPLLGKRNLDSKDAGYLANFVTIKALVEQYGKQGVTTDLLERLVATYLNTSTQYVGQKDIQYAGTLPTVEGKDGLMKIASITGQDIVLSDWLKAAKDPSDVANRKGTLEEPLRQRVEEAVATGNLETLMAKIQGDHAGAHASH